MKMQQLTSCKQAVLLAAKKAYDEKLMAGTSGNLSVFCREQGLIVDVYKRQPSGFAVRSCRRKRS